MRVLVLRWGRSDYETDASLAMERAAAQRLGLEWRMEPDATRLPDLSDVDFLVVTSKVRVDGRALDALAGRAVLTTTSGVDHIDLAAAADRGVQIGRCPLARRDAVVEHALWGMGAMLRRLPTQVAVGGGGRWARRELPRWAPRTLLGARVVVVGLGVIGQRMSDALTALGAEPLGVDPFVPGAVSDLDAVLEGADAITLHCALTASSRGLLGGSRLDRLAPHAVVVNTSRGESLDVSGAVARVRGGRLGGLVCDVFPDEPYAQMADTSHPAIWFTPHAAGFTHDLGARVAAEVEQTLVAWMEGQVWPHPVVASACA